MEATPSPAAGTVPGPGMSLTGQRRLAGFTDQSTPSVWTLTWQHSDFGVLTAAGLIVPLSGSVKHANDVKRLKDQRGNTVTILSCDEALTIELVAVPSAAPGASSLTDVCNAASFPTPNGYLTIANAPVIRIGTFPDAFNANNWLYNGDGSLELASDNEWGMRFTCTRYAFIPAQKAVVIL
jgi:hypothetical protein